MKKGKFIQMYFRRNKNGKLKYQFDHLWAEFDPVFSFFFINVQSTKDIKQKVH